MSQRLPSTNGIRRVRKSAALHRLVVETLQDIADSEDKSFSYVVTEIVYNFFGLKIGGHDVLKITWAGRTKKAGKGYSSASRPVKRRNTRARVLRFEKGRNAKGVA